MRGLQGMDLGEVFERAGQEPIDIAFGHRRGAAELRPGHSGVAHPALRQPADIGAQRSEEHTSELQSQSNLVCRLLLEKKNKKCTQALASWPNTSREPP